MVNPSNYRIDSTISRRDAPGKRFLVQLSRRSPWFEGLTTNACGLQHDRQCQSLPDSWYGLEKAERHNHSSNENTTVN